MATATATRPRRTTAAKKAAAKKAAAPKVAAPKVDYSELKFAFELQWDAEGTNLADEVDRYIEHAGDRKKMASTQDKAQYWAGQQYAMKALKAALTTIMVDDDTAEAEVEPTE